MQGYESEKNSLRTALDTIYPPPKRSIVDEVFRQLLPALIALSRKNDRETWKWGNLGSNYRERLKLELEDPIVFGLTLK